MVGKNNHEVKREKSTEKVHKYSIRKFKNGVASAAIGAILLGAVNVDAVSAEETSTEDGEAEVTAVAPAQAATPDQDFNELYSPITTTVNKAFGEAPTVEELINAVSFGDTYPSNYDVPEVSVPATATLPDGQTPGTTTVMLRVEYPDGSFANASVAVTTAEAPVEVSPLDQAKEEAVQQLRDAGVTGQVYYDQIANANTVEGVENLAAQIIEAYNDSSLDRAKEEAYQQLRDAGVTGQIYYDQISNANTVEGVQTLADQIVESYNNSALDRAKEEAYQRLRDAGITGQIFYDQIRRANTVEGVETLTDEIIRSNEESQPEEETASAYISYEFVDADGDVVGQNSQVSNEEGVVGDTHTFPATGIVLPDGYNLVPGQTFGDRLEVTYGNRDDYPTIQVEVVAQEPEVETARAYIAYEFVDEDGNVVHRNSQYTNEEGVVGETHRFPATSIVLPDGYNLVPGQSFGDQLAVEYGNRDDYPTITVEVVAEEPEVETARAYIAYEFVDADGNVVHRNSQYTNEEGVVGETHTFPATGIVLPDGYNLVPGQSFGDLLAVEYGNRDDYPTITVRVQAVEEEETPEEPGDDLKEIIDRIDDLEDRVDELEEENQELRDELERLQDELDRLREDQEAAQDRIDELEDRVDELEDQVEDLEARPTPEGPTDEDSSDDVDDQDDADDQDDDRPAPEDPTDIVVEADDGDDGDDDADDAEALPQTGATASGIGLGVASLLSGLGLAFVGKKRKEDE